MGSMTNPRLQLHPSQPPNAPSSEAHWLTPTRVYRGAHRNDWLILAFFAALPLLTGLDIGHELGWSTQSGRLALLLGLVVAALWASIYSALKIAATVRVSAAEISVYQGPWHRSLTWHDTVRLTERARAGSLRDERWVVAEAADRRRLTIPASSLADYERFVHDVHATFADWRAHMAHTLRDEVRLDLPLVAVERPQPIAWPIASGLGLGILGVLMLALARGLAWAGVVLLAGGAAVMYRAARRRLSARSLQLDDRGVEIRTRLGTSALTWTAITGVEQVRRGSTIFARAADTALDSALRLLLSTDRWTGGVPWPRHVPVELVIKGAGRRLRLRLDRVEAPDELLAHLEAWLRLAARAKAAASPVRRITQRLAAVPKPTAPLDVSPPTQAPGEAGPLS
jgi:hypothetical protein